MVLGNVPFLSACKVPYEIGQSENTGSPSNSFVLKELQFFSDFSNELILILAPSKRLCLAIDLYTYSRQK